MKKPFRYLCSYCGLVFNDDNWFIDNYVFGHKAYFDQGCIDEINKIIKGEKMLCDGDCGNCYNEEDLNRTHCGQDLCKECMFHFMREQEDATSTEHIQ